MAKDLSDEARAALDAARVRTAGGSKPIEVAAVLPRIVGPIDALNERIEALEKRVAEMDVVLRRICDQHF